MANKKENEKNINKLTSKTSTAVYGMNDDLDIESQRIRSIIKMTSAQTNNLYGARVNGKPIDYSKEMAFSSLFSVNDKPGKNNKKSNETSDEKMRNFKKMMQDTQSADASALLYADPNYILQIQNYYAIRENIPECGTCLDIIKDNILSPDDYTKMLFEITYDSNDINEKTSVLSNIETLRKKYHFEEKSDEILDSALVTGMCPVAILSLENEFETMLAGTSTLNEAAEVMRSNDFDSHNIQVSGADVNDITLKEANTLIESFDVSFGDSKKKEFTNGDKLSVIKESIADLVNKHVHIGSPKEMVIDRVLAQKSNMERLNEAAGYNPLGFQTDIDDKSKRKNKRKDNKPLGLTGSVIRILKPERFIDLTIDDVNYGGLYIETPTAGYSTGDTNYLGTPINSPSTNTSVMTPQGVGQPGLKTTDKGQTSSSAQILNVSDAKLKLISDIFLRTITKKIDKEFIRNNKQLKDILYNLLKQNYIINNDIKVTYFTPEELVIFRVPPIYKKIVFFAKLYLATLTNTLLIKLGRGHDKRVFYIEGGLDNNIEQAVNTVIQDIKTKEYKLSSINSISTILQLNPGSFDDYFLPRINGEQPISIETLAGMDVDINNEFIQFLKTSMLSGMNVPATLIDELQNLEYARKLASQNANFMRFILRYQLLLTPCFDRLVKQLYANEFVYAKNVTDEETGNTKTEYESAGVLDNIEVSFPSPANLNQSNITDQIQTAEANAQFVVDTLIPAKADMSNEDERALLKAKVVKDMVPSLDWEKYSEMASENKKDVTIEKIKEKNKPLPQDNYGGGAY